jgi:hypothetical protein
MSDDQPLLASATAVTDHSNTTNYMVENYSFNERLQHYIPGGHVENKHLNSVQSACIFEAGRIVFAMQSLKEKQQEEMFEKEYTRVIDELPEDLILDDLKEKLRKKIGARKENKDLPMSGAQVKRCFTDIKTRVNAKIVPFLPKTLALLPSGNDLNDAFTTVSKRLYFQDKKKKAHFATAGIERWEQVVSVPDDWQWKQRVNQVMTRSSY